MIELKVTLECGEKTCASRPYRFCQYLRTSHFGTRFWCHLWPDRELEENDRGWLQRMPECLAATQKSRTIYKGEVLSVGPNYFWARLSERGSPDEEDEEGECAFAITDVAEIDRHLIVPGAVFEWRSEILFTASFGVCPESSKKKAQEYLAAFAKAEDNNDD